MNDAVFAVIVFAPLLLTYLLKSNAALGFLALCVGFVLSTSVVGDLKHLLSETNLSVTGGTLAAVLLIAPFAITLLLSRKAFGKGLLLFAHLLAALCGGCLLALSLGPILSGSSQFDITNSSLWLDLVKVQAAVIGAGSFISLVLVWFGKSGHHAKKHK